MPVLEPSWVRAAVWWHVYPLGFTGAPIREPDERPPATARLDRLTAYLDYAVELGASGLLLGPVFASETHGYDTVDHFRIDPRLGDDAAFDRLVAAARERGLRVLLDGVFHHIGRSSERFRRAEADPHGPDARWFRRDASGDWAVFEGHAALVALDHTEPAVADFVVDVMTHWLDRGIAGWRLDAAYAVPRDFWARVLPRVLDRHPDAYLVGEVIHGDYAAFVRETGMHAVTQYELWKAIWSSIVDGNFFELAWALQRHDALLDAFVPLTFVGNHDVTRIASRLDDDRHVPHALAVLLGVAGTPAVYAGDERGMRGVKEDRVGGDDAVRPEFPVVPPGPHDPGAEVYRLHQLLIGVRRRHPWLHAASSRPLLLRNRVLVLESAARGADGGNRVIIALSLEGVEQRIRWDELGADAGAAPSVALAGDARLDGDGVLALPPHGWGLLE